PALPLEVFIRREELPDLTDPANNDKHATILPPGGDVVLGVRDSPPLQAGRYFIAVYNPHGVRVCYRIRGRLERELDSTFSRTFTSDGPSDLTDRGVAYSKITINETRPVSAIQVGIRVEHPRESDLAIRLVNPAGSSSLLAESRGTTNGQGFGSELVTDNGAFSHFAFVYDRASTRGVLYVNGVNVAEGVFPGYAPVTATPLYFGFDPSPGAATGGRPGLDDFALWGGPLRSVEVLNIFRNGLGGLGKNADSASSKLISLWPFDSDGTDYVGTNDISFSAAGTTLPGGRIGHFRKIVPDGTADFALASPSLDVAKGRGFTLDGWVSAGTKPDVTIAGWGGTNGLAPAVLANATGELGNGPGSVSVVLSRSPLRVLKSPAGSITATGKTTNTLYAVFTELTNQTSQLIKFAEPPFFTDTRTRLVAKSGFNTITTNSGGFYGPGETIDGWLVVSNFVQGFADASVTYEGAGCISVFPQPKPTRIRRTMATIPGRYYTASFAIRRSPFASSGFAEVELLTGGVPLTKIEATDLWQTNAYTFVAVSNTMVLDVRESAASKKSV
ncbi:MAG: LamG-like jellyroll fold domain-containing protein, partial [Verrucomicrobiota bacterium]